MGFLRLGPVLIQVLRLAAVVAAAENAKDIVCSKVLPDSRSVYGWVRTGAAMNRQTWSFSVQNHPGLGIVLTHTQVQACVKGVRAPTRRD